MIDIKKSALALTISALACAVAPGTAQAAWKRVSPERCTGPLIQAANQFYPGNTAMKFNPGAWSTGDAFCSLDEDDRVNTQNVSWVQLITLSNSPYYGSGDPYMKMYVCEGFFDGTGGYSGGACGGVTNRLTHTGGSNYLDISVFHQFAGNPYVWVRGMDGDILDYVAWGG